MSSGAASYHAIYVVLNDLDFFEASLRSVYPHITGATVVTSYDRDRFGRTVRPDETVRRLLARELDPERKVNVLVAVDGSEASLRNRAMSFALPPPRARRVAGVDVAASATSAPPPDWFWIIDADEIYDEDDIVRLKAFVQERPARAYHLHAYNYFRSWNWRIQQWGNHVVLLRPGEWFGLLRHRRRTGPARVVQKLVHEGLLPERTGLRLQRARLVPRDVAVFHHGSYVGDRDRIAGKLRSSGHQGEFTDRWLETVWDAWTPAMRDLHPVEPSWFPSTAHVPTAELPAAVRRHAWPAGWIEPA